MVRLFHDKDVKYLNQVEELSSLKPGHSPGGVGRDEAGRGGTTQSEANSNSTTAFWTSLSPKNNSNSVVFSLQTRKDILI